VEDSSVFGPWTPFAAVVVTLLALVGLQRWITRSLQELSMRWLNDPDVTLIIYFVLVLPGVIIHELSHWSTAKLLGVRVSLPRFGPVRKGRSNRVSLGSVQVGRADPVRASIIGVAPLLGGSGVILLIGSLVLGVGEIAEAMAGQGLAGILDGLTEIARIADFWIWLYLIFAVANAMLPSESDMATVRPVLIFLGIVGAVVLIVTGVPSIPERTVQRVNDIAAYLAYAFGVTLGVDLLVVVLLLLLLWITRQLQR
jgi:hypothetical protein